MGELLTTCDRQEIEGIFSTDIPREGKRFGQVDTVDFSITDNRHEEQYDPFSYVFKELLLDLRREKGESISENACAVVGHIASLMILPGLSLPDTPTMTNSGTAIQIDESGYYITTAHGFLKDIQGLGSHKSALVLDHATGKANPVDSVIFDRDYDIAIVYAPTGRQRKPVENLQFRVTPLQSGETVWGFGSLPHRREGTHSIPIELIEFSGTLNNPPYVDNPNLIDAVQVNNIRPFQGSSGGPIIDGNGKLVGIIAKLGHDKNSTHIALVQNAMNVFSRIIYFQNGRQQETPLVSL